MCSAHDVGGAVEDGWAGWDAINLLLQRQDIDSTEHTAVSYTCKAGAKLVWSYTRTIFVTLTQRRRSNSHSTATVLEAISPLPADHEPAESSSFRPEIHLTVEGGFEQCLRPSTRRDVTVMTLHKAALTPQQWQEGLAQLSQYPRLHTLRLRACSASGTQDTDVTLPDAEVTVPNLVIESSRAKTRGILPAMRTITDAFGPRCAGFTVPCSAYEPWMRSTCSQEGLPWPPRTISAFAFGHGLHSLHLLLDEEKALTTCLPSVVRLPRLQHLTLTCPSLRMASRLTSSSLRLEAPVRPWQTITLKGVTPIRILAHLPMNVMTKGYISLGLIYPTLEHLESPRPPDAPDTAPQPCTRFRCLPVGGSSPALAATGSMPKTLHLYSPEPSTLEFVVRRMDPEVECVTVHADGGSALCAGTAAVLTNALPPHVTTVSIRLDCITNPTRIFPRHVEPHPFWHNLHFPQLQLQAAQPWQVQDLMLNLQQGLQHDMDEQWQLPPLEEGALQALFNGLGQEWEDGDDLGDEIGDLVDVHDVVGVQPEGQPQQQPQMQLDGQPEQLQQQGEAAAEPQPGQTDAAAWQLADAAAAAGPVAAPAVHLPLQLPDLAFDMPVHAVGGPGQELALPQAPAAEQNDPGLDLILAALDNYLPGPLGAFQGVQGEAQEQESDSDSDGEGEGEGEEVPAPAQPQAPPPPRPEPHTLLPKLPEHVRTVCIEVVNEWTPGERRLSRWQALLRQVADQYTAPQPIKLVLANLPHGPDCYEEDPAPPDADALDPWLPEEKEAILKWRDENMGSDGNVELCLV